MKLVFDLRHEAKGAGKTRTLSIMEGSRVIKKVELNDEEYADLRGALDSDGR